MIATRIYGTIITAILVGWITGTIISRNCCIDEKNGSGALGILIGCLSCLGCGCVLYILSTESQRNCCSGCSKLLVICNDDGGDE